MTRARLLLTALPALLLTASAEAYRQPGWLDERPLELAAGPQGRIARMVDARVPAPARAAFDGFRARRGAWRAIWDADTSAPARIWGEGIAAPGAMADAAAAERAARAVLAEELALLAPGARADDFVATANVVRGGVRTVYLQQRWRGLDVVGAGLRFAFKHDRLIAIGSTATAVDAAAPARAIDGDVARARAVAWVDAHYRAGARGEDVGAPVVLPVARGGAVEHHVVVPVTVDQRAPRARWTVYVDAASGEPVARRQLLLFGEGTVRYRVPDRHPGGGYSEYPAAFTTHLVDGTSTLSTVAGLVSWAGTAASSVAPGLTGAYARITNARGPLATATLALDPDGATVWDLSSDEFGDAQLTAFIHATIAKTYALTTLDPDLPWLHQSMEAVVNEGGGEDVCNAYSNLDDIHFLVAGSIGGINGWVCGNTARLADVVYHEFGHSIHGQAMVGGWHFDGALSEGISDYYAATITGDPAMGLGFFSNMPDSPLRHIDPPGEEARWPEDQAPDTHTTGLIIAGALWDLRKALVEELGEAAGVALADDIFYGIIARADEIPTAYAEALVTDDDDGNLANGTPHKCIIDRTFGAHGLGDAANLYGKVAPPAIDGLTITIDQLAAEAGGCPAPQIETAQLAWRVRGVSGSGGTIDLAADGDRFVATIPAQEDGTVVEYQVVATLDDGAVQRLPGNEADPWYQVYVGEVHPLLCTDFEDGSPTGWQLDGFTWGTPAPPAGSDDPPAAYSGTRVIGTNLAGDYTEERTYRLTLPVVEVGDEPVVRLQYRRWLNVEDGQFDEAAILADGARIWVNQTRFNDPVAHRDAEWRFHDIDLTPLVGDGRVEIAFELSADVRNEFGGWTLDDVCIVAPGPPPPEPMCGEEGAEPCDEPVDPGGCCSSSRGGPAGPLLLALGAALALRRRKPRAGRIVT